MIRLNEEQTQTLAREARAAAKAIRKAYPMIPADDLQQEAWSAMLSKVGDYRPEGGPFGAYVYRIALNACQRYAWKALSITSAPRRKSACEIARQKAASVDLLGMSADSLPVDAAIEELERQAALSRLVAEHLAHTEAGRAVFAVLTGEAKSAEAAEAAGVDVARLYYLTNRTKKAIRADPRFRAFV